MFQKAKIVFFPVATLVVFLVAVTAILVPPPALSEFKYSAGNFSPGMTICLCPVTLGDCACIWDSPEPE